MLDTHYTVVNGLWYFSSYGSPLPYLKQKLLFENLFCIKSMTMESILFVDRKYWYPTKH